MIENATVKNAALFLCRFLFLWKLQNRNKWFLVQIISYAGVEISVRKKLDEFSITCLILFEYAILVHFIFIRNGPKLQIRDIWKWTKIANLDSSDQVSSGNFGPLSNSSNLQFQSTSKKNRVDQNCIFEPNLTRDIALVQTRFWSKILIPAYLPVYWLTTCLYYMLY